MFDPHQDLSPLEIEQELTRRYGEPTRRVRCIQNWMQREGLGREVGEGKARRRVATWAEVEAFSKAKGYRLDTKGNRAGGGKAKRADVAAGQQVLGLEDPAVKEAVEKRVEQEVARRIGLISVPLEQQLMSVVSDLHRFMDSGRSGAVSLEDLPDGVKKLGSEIRMLNAEIEQISVRQGKWIARDDAHAVVDGLVEVLLSRLDQLDDEVATQVRLQLSKVDGRDEEQRDRAVAEGARVAVERVRKSIVEAVEQGEGGSEGARERGERTRGQNREAA